MATYGGGIIINSTGGGTYSWSNTSQSPVFFSVPSGMYAQLSVIISSSRPVAFGSVVTQFSSSQVETIIMHGGSSAYVPSYSTPTSVTIYYNFVIFKNSGVSLLKKRR